MKHRLGLTVGTVAKAVDSPDGGVGSFYLMLRGAQSWT